MSDKDNGAPGTLGNIGKAAEHGAHFVCPVHIGLFAYVCLYGVKDNQPRPVLRDCFLDAFVGQGKFPFCFINHKHPVKICGSFYQAGLDGIAQTVLGGLINHLKRLHGLHARKRPASGTGGGKAQRKGSLALAGVALYYGYFPKGDIRFP